MYLVLLEEEQCRRWSAERDGHSRHSPWCRLSSCRLVLLRPVLLEQKVSPTVSFSVVVSAAGIGAVAASGLLLKEKVLIGLVCTLCEPPGDNSPVGGGRGIRSVCSSVAGFLFLN